MKTAKIFFSKPPSLFSTRFSLFPKPFLFFGGGFHVGFLSHMYRIYTTKTKNLVSYFWVGFSFPLARSCTTLVTYFLGCHPQRKPTNTSRPAWNVKRQQPGVIVSYVSGSPSTGTRQHGKEGRKTVKGMTWNGYKCLVPTKKQGIFGWLNS